MAIDWQRWVNLVRVHRRFVVTSHVRPDGDSLGCAVALAHALRDLGKETAIVNPSPAPQRYRFLDPERCIVEASDPRAAQVMADAEVVIVVDTSTWDQLGPVRELIQASGARRVVIDHHVSEDDLGAEMFKDTTIPACGLLVFDALQALQYRLTPRVAEALFTAVATDTGWFRFSSTSAQVLYVAAQLVDAGAQPERIYRRVFEENSLARLHLMGRALERLELSPGGLVSYTYIRMRDLDETGAQSQDTEDVVNYTLTIAEARVGLLFIELAAERTKVSFRSKDDVDSTALAGRFGGGGHRRAAGAVLEMPIEKAMPYVLRIVDQLVAAKPTDGAGAP